MKNSILKTLCVCSLAIAATACSEKQGAVEDNPELVSMGYQGKTIVVKDAVNDDNLVLKVYAKDEATLALCDASNFTFISDPQSQSDYYAKMEALAEAEEEILPDTDDLEEPEGIDSTYIVDVLQVNLKNPQKPFIFTQDLPNPNANNELKKIDCLDYEDWGCVQRWASIHKIEVWNSASGLCNAIKVKIFDQCTEGDFHGYAWDPTAPSPHDWTFKKNGRKYSKTFEYDESEKVQGPNNTRIWGTVTVCSRPKKEKNRNKLSFIVTYE